jgi:hypothetical protein
MCMHCGCGEPEKRHDPTDITREDLQRAADVSGISLKEAARNMRQSSEHLANGNSASSQPINAGNWSTAKRA